MAKFDVYRIDGGRGYLIDIQADLLGALSTRVVVPLLPGDEVPPPSKRLNPIFHIGPDEVVMATQLMAAVPRSALKTSIANLSEHHDTIVGAIDFLMQGF
ncbi:MAG TPA: CcdB family protein [Alphaproteobacteria bacterium]|nr:CcdB family protein [Alphaproteobacteria bacterium]